MKSILLRTSEAHHEELKEKAWKARLSLNQYILACTERVTNELDYGSNNS